METYGFQGADIDWEYPGDADRGGRRGDADNLVLLVKEMKAAFGGRFGISLTLAPDYWYLRGFKPAEMQDYVDFMGFMSYDLHGPWDADVQTLGSKVRPQTDITEIEKGLIPLWFDGVDPSKINLGLAYYGRTYKLSNPSCGSMGCSFQPGEGGSPGSCTNFPGVLSNREIRRLITDGGYTPFLNKTAMVKYFTYDENSWVGYDDEETYAMKEAFANERCLGGIMIWSVDFDASVGGGGAANGHISPELATVIPMPHTTVPAGATLTVDSGVSTDVAGLPIAGSQNTPRGPEDCQRCSFFRLITSTCCGTGGSVGNPIEIAAGVPLPMDIVLPAGYIPNQPFVASDGTNITPGIALPRETTIPRGTVFQKPFVIPSGQSLRNGEGDDQGDDRLIWIDPAIWDSESPEVQCFPPCTLVLPPWTKTTSTIDYPRITVSRETWTSTITRPPITVVQWQVETIIVDNDRTQTGNRTLSPHLSTTTTWPPISYPDNKNQWHTTTPTGPHPPPPGPPPPPKLPWPPRITFGLGPPWPKVPKCLFSALNCPPPGITPRPGIDDGGSSTSTPTGSTVPITTPIPPGENAARYEDQEDKPDDDACLLLPTTTEPPTTTQAPPPPPLNQPDVLKNVKKCFGGTHQWSRRSRAIQAIERFCDAISGKTLGPRRLFTKRESWDYVPFDTPEIVPIGIVTTIEVKAGCEWKVDTFECGQQLRIPIDKCNEDGEDHKQGGTLENNCLKWTIDVEAYG